MASQKPTLLEQRDTAAVAKRQGKASLADGKDAASAGGSASASLQFKSNTSPNSGFDSRNPVMATVLILLSFLPFTSGLRVIVQRVKDEHLGKEVLNSVTALATGLLIERTSSDYYAVSVALFSLISAANHFCPYFRPGLANLLVKLTFTHVFVSAFSLSPSLGFALNIFGDWLVEDIGTIWRVALRFYMASQCPLWVAGVWLFLEMVYKIERTLRIRRGERHNYSFYHCVEHVNIVFLFAYFFNIPLEFHTSVMLLALAYWALVILVVGAFNFHCVANLEQGLPAWFDKEKCLQRCRKKTEDNLWAVFTGAIMIPGKSCTAALRFVDWKDIETTIDGIIQRHGGKKHFGAEYDMCVGIFSGGGFIVPYVSLASGINNYAVIGSRFWSGKSTLDCLQVFSKMLKEGETERAHDVRRASGQGPALKMTSKVQIDDEKLRDVKGMRILLVDDSCASGTTMRTVRQKLLDMGAETVSTLAMSNTTVFVPTYTSGDIRIPLFWPWGFECD